MRPGMVGHIPIIAGFITAGLWREVG